MDKAKMEESYISMDMEKAPQILNHWSKIYNKDVQIIFKGGEVMDANKGVKPKTMIVFIIKNRLT